MRSILGIICIAALTPVAAFAQAAAPADPISQSLNGLYNAVKRNVKESAEKVPEEHYGFKPTADVRSFGQLIGHIADAQFMFCAGAKGEKNPNATSIEKSKTTKADLVKSLDESIAYCDAVYSGMTDARAAEVKKAPAFMGGQSSVAGFLAVNASHSNEHYGNLVTYMRLKGIVPPSTERSQQPRRPSGQQ
jgi:uncharacterized damage-inducible protein DinB